VLNRHRVAEAQDRGPHEQRGEGDLGHEDEGRAPGLERALGHAEVDLRLAAAGDAVQQEGPESALLHRCLELPQHRGLVFGVGRPHVLAAGHRLGAAHVALFLDPYRSLLGELGESGTKRRPVAHEVGHAHPSPRGLQPGQDLGLGLAPR
jgi:hypothetical protein